MRTAMLLLIAGLVSSSSLAAQAPLPVTPGQRVRLTLDGRRRVTGVVDSLDADSLRLTLDSYSPPIAIARTGIAGIERSTHRNSNAGAGALIGLVSGGMLGAAAGSSCEGDFLCPGPAAGGAAVGLLGAALGGLIGAFSHSETWEAVYQRGVQMGVAPVEGRGIGLGVRVAF